MSKLGQEVFRQGKIIGMQIFLIKRFIQKGGRGSPPEGMQQATLPKAVSALRQAPLRLLVRHIFTHPRQRCPHHPPPPPRRHSMPHCSQAAPCAPRRERPRQQAQPRGGCHGARGPRQAGQGLGFRPPRAQRVPEQPAHSSCALPRRKALPEPDFPHRCVQQVACLRAGGCEGAPCGEHGQLLTTGQLTP